MKDKKRFKIGDWVHVKATMTTDYELVDGKQTKVVIKDPSNITGQIVGLKRFCLGKYYGGTHPIYPISVNNYFEPDDFDPSYLLVTSTILVWEVKEGMLNKVIYACDEDVSDGVLTYPGQRVPLLHSIKPSWTHQDRQNLRCETAKVPRDKKGQWTKQLN